jgi:hypothetical protein
MTNCHEWSRLPVSALASHLAEVTTTQKLELAALHRFLPKDDGVASTYRIFETLLTCLQRELDAHNETSRRLSWLIASIEHGKSEAEPAQLQRLLRRGRVERESILGILDYADRATAGFTSPSETAEERSLIQALARWDRAERAHLRLEGEGLALRALALAALPTPVALRVRRLELLSATGGAHRLNTVYCPGERRSVALDWCRGCPLLRRIGADTVECTPDVDALTSSRAQARLGDGASVGEAMGAKQVSASPEVPVGRIARVLADTPGAAAVLVDDALHVLGFVQAAEAASAPAVQKSDALAERGPAVLESASLADAVAIMAKAHRRYLPVIGDDERAVGVLSDLDALHWIASHPSR